MQTRQSIPRYRTEILTEFSIGNLLNTHYHNIPRTAYRNFHKFLRHSWCLNGNIAKNLEFLSSELKDQLYIRNMTEITERQNLWYDFKDLLAVFEICDVE